MTYNFDPDIWYDNEYAAVKQQYRSGSLSKAEFDHAAKTLQVRLDEMWKRLDGSYDIPNSSDDSRM